MIWKDFPARLMLLFIGAVAIYGCQKMNRPPLGDYQPDHLVTPATPLRFYVPFDSTKETAKQINIRFADSISDYPSFFPDKSIGITTGVHGTAVQLAQGKALQYVNANDFAAASSFTVAFWMKAPGVPSNAQFVMSLVDKDFWHYSGMFILIDHSGAGSTPDSAAVSFVAKDNWYLFHGKDRIPKILDKQWHHVAFVYDHTISKLATYVDGVALTGLSADATTHLTGPLGLNPASVSNLIIGGWNKHVGVTGPTDSWIESFPGALDQFRLYNKALSASEVLALFNSKL